MHRFACVSDGSNAPSTATPLLRWLEACRYRAEVSPFVRERLARQAQRRGESQVEVARAFKTFDENALTLGFARRFATYKRAPLIFKEAKRLAALLAAALGAPVLLLRSRPLAIVGWLLVSLVGTGLATWAYYLIWPPQWEAPAYKIAGMVLKGYWKQLTPLALLTGGLCGWLTTRPAAVSSQEETG